MKRARTWWRKHVASALVSELSLKTGLRRILTLLGVLIPRLLTRSTRTSISVSVIRNLISTYSLMPLSRFLQPTILKNQRKTTAVRKTRVTRRRRKRKKKKKGKSEWWNVERREENKWAYLQGNSHQSWSRLKSIYSTILSFLLAVSMKWQELASISVKALTSRFLAKSIRVWTLAHVSATVCLGVVLFWEFRVAPSKTRMIIVRNFTWACRKGKVSRTLT